MTKAGGVNYSLKVLSETIILQGVFLRKISITLVGVLGIALTGCGNMMANQKVERTTYFHPVRQVAPEPIYNRITMVRPPDTLPFMPIGVRQPYVNRDVRNVGIQADDVPLEEAAEMIASAMGYKHYCSSLIAKRKVSIKQNGTIEQLAADLSRKENIEVVIDHDSREIRFLQQRGKVSTK